MRKIIVSSQNKALKVSGSFLAYQDGNVPSGYRQLTGITYNGQVWYETDLYLMGSDTLKVSFKATKACNLLGCYTTTSAQDNYSIYLSTTSGAKYLRYNGGTYSSYIVTNTQYNLVVTPTGSTGFPTSSTWTQKTFTAPSLMMIGTTSRGATSAKMTGTIYGNIEVVGRALYIPVQRTSDNAIGYFELYSEKFYENLGTGTPVALGYVS